MNRDKKEKFYKQFEFDKGTDAENNLDRQTDRQTDRLL